MNDFKQGDRVQIAHVREPSTEYERITLGMTGTVVDPHYKPTYQKEFGIVVTIDQYDPRTSERFYFPDELRLLPATSAVTHER